jgi:hypothetical protein
MSNKPLSAAEFAEAVITHWPPFRWDQHQAGSWTQSLVRELSAFDRQVLGNALAHLIRTRRDTKTPTVAICIDACVTERRYLEAQKRVESLPEAQHEAGKFPAYSPQRKDTVDLLVKCKLGKQAAREGWISTMYAFAMEHGRLPRDDIHVAAPLNLGPHPIRPYVGMTEIAMCKRQAKDFDDAYAKLIRGEIVADGHQKWTDEARMKGLLAGKRWESTGEAMLKERNRIADMVLSAQ